jgi:hypothetical protein
MTMTLVLVPDALDEWRMARRDDREYWLYVRKEQRRQAGCIAGRMPGWFRR